MWMLLGLSCGLLTWPSPDDPTEPPALDDDELRSTAMREHQVAVHRARDAVIAQDLDGVRRAGALLASERDVPRLPDPALEVLDEVRRAGVRLSETQHLDGAASQLVELTASCARCHTMLEVPPEVPLQATQRDVLWTALVFRSEEHWAEGARRDPTLAGLRYWEDRRLAVSLRLQGGQL